MGHVKRNDLKKLQTTAHSWTFKDEAGSEFLMEIRVTKIAQRRLKLSETSRRKSSKIVARRRRVFELRCIGYKIPQIVEKLAEEGRCWHENTIETDLQTLKRQTRE